MKNPFKKNYYWFYSGRISGNKNTNGLISGTVESRTANGRHVFNLLLEGIAESYNVDKSNIYMEQFHRI